MHKWGVFIVPETKKVVFYPVLATGKGQLWIDEVQLVDLSKPPGDEIKEILPQLDAQFNQDPYKWELGLELAKTYLRFDKLASAENTLKRLVDACENTCAVDVFAQTYSLLGQLNSARGDFAEAINNYQKSLQLQPQNEVAATVLAETYLAFLEQDGIVLNPENLIANGGFENGSNGWRVNKRSGTNSEFGVTETEFFEGKHSFSIIGKTDEYHAGLYQEVQVQANKPYLFSFWVKATEEDDLSTDVLHNNLHWEYLVANGEFTESFTGSSDWVHKWGVFIVPETKKVVFYPVLATGKGQLWIDEVQLVDLSKPTEGD